MTDISSTYHGIWLVYQNSFLLFRLSTMVNRQDISISFTYYVILSTYQKIDHSPNYKKLQSFIEYGLKYRLYTKTSQ